MAEKRYYCTMCQEDITEPIQGLIDNARQAVAEEIRKSLEKEFGYLMEKGKLAKLIVDDGGYYGHEGALQEYQEFWKQFEDAK